METLDKSKIHKKRHQEWYTPSHIIKDMAHVIYGEDSNEKFELDPCTSLAAQAMLPKDVRPVWSIDKDGNLYADDMHVKKVASPDSEVWSGYDSIWCNPPFDNAKLFLETGIKTVDENRYTSIAYLLPANTEAIWMQDFMKDYDHLIKVVVFLKRRLQFFDGMEMKKANQNSTGSILFILNGNEAQYSRLIKWAHQSDHWPIVRAR